MENKKSLILLMALAFIFAGCKEESKQNNKNEKSVVIKSDEDIKEENIEEDFYDLVNAANSDLSDEEKTFLAEVLKDIENKDAENLSSKLADPLKSEVGGDLRVLAKKLIPVDYTGPILEIKELTKKDDSYLVIGKCEDDSLVILLGKDKNDKLTSLDIKLLSTITKNKELEKDNEAFVDRSYEIIEALRNGDKDLFYEDVKGLNLEEEKFSEMYEGLKNDLDQAGDKLTDESKVEVSFASDLIKTAPFDQNLVDVTLIFTYEHIEKIVYNFVYTEDMRLISLEVGPDEK